jgi:hypothetical protein
MSWVEASSSMGGRGPTPLQTFTCHTLDAKPKVRRWCRAPCVFCSSPRTSPCRRAGVLARAHPSAWNPTCPRFVSTQTISRTRNCTHTRVAPALLSRPPSYCTFHCRRGVYDGR